MSQFVTIFSRKETPKIGFVVPRGVGGLVVEWANIHKRIPDAVQNLEENYEFSGFTDAPLDQLIRHFAKFCTKARFHLLQGREGESLLHYVIALEIIFGETGGKAQSISDRVAVITHMPSP